MSSTNSPSTSAPEVHSGVSKKIYLRTLDPEKWARTETPWKAEDWLGAVVRGCHRLSDSVFISSEIAPLVTSLWRTLAREHGEIINRIVDVSDWPVVTPGVVAGMSETAALAFEGLRCTYIGAIDYQSLLAVEPPAGSPFVLCIIDQARDTQALQADFEHFELVAHTAQEAADFLLVAHLLSERSLCPGIVRIELNPTTYAFDRVSPLNGEQLQALLGSACDFIETPTDLQRDTFGASRRRIPVRPPADLDRSALLEDIDALADDVFAEFGASTGRSYERSDRSHTPTPQHSNGKSGLTVNVQSERATDLARRVAAACIDAGAAGVTVTSNSSGSGASLRFGPEAVQSDSDVEYADALIVAGTKRRRLDVPLTALKIGGLLVIESSLKDPEEIWQAYSDSTRQVIRDRGTRAFVYIHDGLTSAIQRYRSFESAAARLLTHFPAGDIPSDEEILPDLVELSWSDYEISIPFSVDDRTLRMPLTGDTEAGAGADARTGAEAGGAEAGANDVVLKTLLAFHQSGVDVGQRLEDSRMIPVSLYPYLNLQHVREPYPFCLSLKGDVLARSLTDIFDDLIAHDDSEAGNENRSKQLLRIESEIRSHSEDHQGMLLSEFWNMSAVASDSAELIGSTQLDIDGPLFGFSSESQVRLIDRAHDRPWAERLSSARREADDLSIRIDEILRRDYSESSEGRAPEHLKASVGKPFAAELDFDALSGMIGETNHADSLTKRRRHRLTSVADDLTQLPQRLAEAREHGVFSGEGGLREAVASVRRDRKLVVALARAVENATLEANGTYREDKHDDLFARLSFEDLPSDVRRLCPPYTVRLDPSAFSNPSTLGTLIGVLSSDMPIKVALFTDDIPSGFAGDGDGSPHRVATQTVSLGAAYVVQAPASQLAMISEATERSTRWDGPALYSIYIGSKASRDSLGSYLASAVALESRAFPVFEFDPSGSEWVDRFNVLENPSSDMPWGCGHVELVAGKDHDSMPTTYTFADFLACDARYLDQFRVVKPEMWHSNMIQLDEFLALQSSPGGARDDNRDLHQNESLATIRIPFLWMADDEGVLHRVIVTDKVVKATERVLSQWVTLQELGGIRSSHALRLIEEATRRIEEEQQAALDEIRNQYQLDLDRTTGEVARDIVSNIAAGLLGLQQTGFSALPPAGMATQRIQPGQATTKGQPAKVGQQNPAESSSESTASDESESLNVAAAQPEEEDEEIISMDDPYIETIRCTTCNECTNINPRLFSYNENQQAYVKDATAGTFAELVAAAELCPVKIIHPGKPLHSDEPGLEELLERAKPYQ